MCNNKYYRYDFGWNKYLLINTTEKINIAQGIAFQKNNKYLTKSQVWIYLHTFVTFISMLGVNKDTCNIVNLWTFTLNSERLHSTVNVYTQQY